MMHPWCARMLGWVCALALLVLPYQARAQTSASAAGGLEPSSAGLLAQSRDGVRRGTEWLARGVDGWFGDRPFEEGGRVSGSVKLRTLWREDRAARTGLTFRARFDLPNLKDRTYLFFGQDNERDLVTNQPAGFTRQQQLISESRSEDQTLFAGLGYALRENLELRAGVRGGYKVYAQARYLKRWQLADNSAFEFRETVFWTVSDRFGSTTAFDYVFRASPSLTYSWRNAATITQRSDGFEWSSSAGAFRSFGDQRTLGVEALMNGRTRVKGGVGEYGLRGTWRQALHEDWLMGELIIGHFWPRGTKDDDRRVWAVGAGVEMLF